MQHSFKNFFILMFLSFTPLMLFAQTFTGMETRWAVNYNAPATDRCASTNAGVLTYGENINNDAQVVNYALGFSSPSSVVAEGCPSWFGFMANDQDQQCFFIKEYGGVDLSQSYNRRLEIYAKSDVPGAILTVYLGSAASNSDFPSSSTWNTGTATIKVDFTLTSYYAAYTYGYDFEPSDIAAWNAWSESQTVNVIGFTPQTANARYYIQRIDIGGLVSKTATDSYKTLRTTGSNTCGTAANIPLSVTSSNDYSVTITAANNGHIQIDPSYVVDKVVVCDMYGRTEEFNSNEFYTSLKGMLVLNCISGDKVKKVKVVPE